MNSQRGARVRLAASSAAFVAALTFAGAPAPASAATSSAATASAAAPVAADFPTYFYLRNPSQGARCVTPAESWIGELSLQTCGPDSQLFFSYTSIYTGFTFIVSLYSPADLLACMATDETLHVYTKDCDFTEDGSWEQIGATVRNTAIGRCLSANAAGKVFVAACDGTVNGDWEFPQSVDAESAKAFTAADSSSTANSIKDAIAVKTAAADRRAQLAGAVR